MLLRIILLSARLLQSNRSRLILGLCLLLLLSSVILAQDSEPTAIPEPPIEITIWLPDTLAVPNNTAANDIFQAQTAAFMENENIIVHSRLKRVGTIGGIMSTLRTASTVAPTALPALTLLRRQDLINAERDGLIQSMENLVPSSIQGDLDTALDLGQVRGNLYGVPYMLDLQHIIYRPQDDVNYRDWDYESFLARGENFIFSAGQPTLSDVFFLQYTLSGGTSTRNRDGTLALNEAALLTSLEFYEQAVTNDLIDSTVLDYTSPENYLDAFVDGDINAGMFSSSTFLSLYPDNIDLRIAPIPTENGTDTGILNGWIWVMVATDPIQQDAAIRYLTWMMDSNRQAEYARAITMLPSQRSAIQQGLVGGANARSYTNLLDNAVVSITENEGGNLASSIRDALTSVIQGNRTAAEATQIFVSQQTDN